MFTSYITSKNYIGLSAAYAYDKQLDFINKNIAIDGALTTSFSPVFSGTNDFIKSNYSLLHVTKPISLVEITDFDRPFQASKNYFCNIFNRVSGSNVYLTFTNALDEQLFFTVNYDQTVTSLISGLNDFYYFNFDFTKPHICTISHLYNNNEYFLTFNPATLNLNFVILSAFTPLTVYNKDFFYTFNKEDLTLSLQARIGGKAYQVIRDNVTKRLTLSGTDTISFTDTRAIFYLTAFFDPKLPEVTIDWGSYLRTFNQNNITIDNTKSVFDVRTNFLIYGQYFNLERSGLITNLLPLKTQLNTQNQQGRGNVFLNEEPVNYRNYVSIFGGPRQEKGYEKLHLQYESYSTPFTFNQGKTTWFHMPQNMYPYDRLNIKDTKLIEAGAIGGDHPLRSDKVFKKIANYKNTSNQGDSSGELTGQWLCSWLSAAPDISVRPIWVDRYYNPKLNTPFEALSATRGSVTYIPSFDCYDLSVGITDVPSSLTFEPGGWYAYSHIGKSDAEQNIKALTINQQQKNLSFYERVNGRMLDPYLDEDNTDTYIFDGTSYGLIDARYLQFPLNTFTISFWASREDWTVPTGYQLGGNYTDYGLGIYNYELVTPLLFYPYQGNILAYNQNLELVDYYEAPFNRGERIEHVSRRDPLNSFHIFTNTQTIAELNLQETIIDGVTGLITRPIIDVTNDATNSYLLLDNYTLSGINLVSNLAFPVTADFRVSTRGIYQTIRKTNNNKIVLVDGAQSIVRGNNIYFVSGGYVKVWGTENNTISSYISTPVSRFNIDKYNNTWTASGNKINVYGKYTAPLNTFTLTADSSLSQSSLTALNITFIENFNNGALQSSVIIAASGSQTNKLVLTKLNYDGKIEKQALINADLALPVTLDPSNHNYNYSNVYNTVSGNNNYTFKIRLYNEFNTEDIEIPKPTVYADDLNPGYHHFSIVVNTVKGYTKLYLDGELYDTINFTPSKYSFTPLIGDDIIVGACPFYNGSLFDTFLSNNNPKGSYFVKDIQLQNLYIHSTELNYFDINMLYKEKSVPQDLVWDVPSGRRNYIETVSRYFTQQVPGAKSTLFNVYINDSILNQECRDYLQTAIIKKIKDIVPGYSKLNNLQWVSNLPAQSAEYVQPYFPGNTLTNAGLTP
jgi:hypothetical protein